ncbi:major facilitator superfamily domain-containing protein [Umbelopsis sp. PMI_123]|nr:major facilitator superfamily domain-containing protein [Umbelopsis sp. PMI_123]
MIEENSDTVVSSTVTETWVEVWRRRLSPLAYAVFVSAQAVDIMSISGVVVTLENIQEKYGTDLATTSWVLSAYSVTFGGFILLFGRIGDVLGHHLVFAYGLLIFAILSALCAGIENFMALVILRALQGLCAASTVPSSFAIIANSYTGKTLNLALSGIACVHSVSYGIGLVVGGAVVRTSIGYTATFWVFFGISLIGGLLSLIVVKPMPTSRKDLLRLDFFGSLLLVGGAILVIVGLTYGGQYWNSPLVYVLLPVGVVLIVVFMLWEVYFASRPKSNMFPLIPNEIWRIQNFKPILFATAMVYGGYFTILLNMVQYFQYVVGDSALIAGVKFFPAIITLVIVVLTIRYGMIPAKWACVSGMVIATVGIVIISLMKPDSLYWRYAVPGLILVSFGCVLYFIHYINMIMTVAPLNMQGLVTGIYQTAAQIATALAFSASTSILGDITAQDPSTPEKFKHTFYLGMACTAAGAIVVLILVSPPRTAQAQAETPDDSEKDVVIDTEAPATEV